MPSSLALAAPSLLPQLPRANIPPVPEVNVKNIQAVTAELEGARVRYYVYDDDALSLPKIRDKAKRHQKPFTLIRPGGRLAWGTRFADYARGEIRWLESLENSSLRTRNPYDAAFFVVPIPMTATFFWGRTEDRINALRRVFLPKNVTAPSPFHRFPGTHVIIAVSEKLTYSAQSWGLASHELIWLKNTIVIRDSDEAGFGNWLLNHNRHWCRGNQTGRQSPPLLTPRHGVALGYSFEASNPEYSYSPVTLEGWTANKTNWFFYHSRAEPSLCNSTIFRHALFERGLAGDMARREAIPNQTPVSKQFRHQPVSIAVGDMPPEEWKREFRDSKFCLTIRGDNPASRSLYRAIRAGCMPLIVSDSLPAYHPLFSKSLDFEDFAVMVGEDKFMADPVRSLDDAVSSLSLLELRHKVEGLRLLQRILTCDQPNSLFVPGVSKEIIQAMPARVRHSFRAR